MNNVRSGHTLRASSSVAEPRYATGRALLIASSFVLLLLAAIFSVQARAATTGSEKFIPTFLIYSGGPALVAADAPRLAKFDLIDIDRFRYREIGSNTWAAIKSLNPAVQIYLYQMGPESPSHLDSTAQLNLNGLGRHNVSRGHFMGSLNGDRPDLFLLDSTGKRVHNLGSSNPGANQYWYLMDFGATAYQSYWVAAVKADIVDQAWVADGVFANACLTRASDGGYSALPALYPTNAAWSDAMNYFASSITAGLFGYGQKLWCNRGGSRAVDGAAAWLALDQSASPPDVVLEEGAFAISSGAGAVQYLPESEWKRQVDTVGAISNSKVAVVSHTKLLEGQSGTDNHGRSVTYWQTLWYSLGSFLLAKNDVLGNAYFMFRGGSGFNKIWWHDEYDKIDLGKAVGPYAVRKIGSVNIYWREFEKGYVYVNPTATAVGTLTLPQAGRLLTHANMASAPDSIPSVNKISLNSRRAAFVLKAASAPAPDTTTPTVPAGLTGSAVSPSQVNLSWSPSTDNVGVTGYMVYLNDVALATTATTSFSHTGLTPGATYNYRASAFDAIPNHSAQTAAVAVTTPATLSAATPCANPAGGYEGFGSNTTGGAGQTVHRVTNLNNSGPGSLRDAVSAGNRCVVFDVAGTIALTSFVKVGGANVTIDGFTAPSPGVNLTGWGFALHGPPHGTVANIIVRGIRIRGTVAPESVGADGFQISGVNNFVIDRVSIDQWGDGSFDIADGSSNGTIQWSIIGRGAGAQPKSLLVKYGSRRISIHHNLLMNSLDRNPYVAWSDDAAQSPTEIVADVRNNLVWNYGWTGISVRHNAWANVVNNYLFSAAASSADAALYIREGGVAYASGNHSPNGININALGNRATPFPADVPTTTDAVTAAQQIVAQAGARGPNFALDAADLNYIGEISLP